MVIIGIVLIVILYVLLVYVKKVDVLFKGLSDLIDVKSFLKKGEK